MNSAILLAAHGSRRPESHAALESIAVRIRKAWPEIPVAIAITSAHVLKIMHHEGKAADNVKTALNKLHAQGIRRVAVQSLHIIPGREFHDLLVLANDLMVKDKRFERIEVGMPLLAGEDDLALVAKTLMSLVPDDRSKGEAVIFIGHGTTHPGNDFYPALNHKLQQLDPLVFLGVMGSDQDREPSLPTISKWLSRAGVTQAALLPFLFGAGFHVAHDMMGKKSDSWESVLATAGITCRGVLKGSSEYDELSDIWMAHLSDAMDRLKRR